MTQAIDNPAHWQHRRQEWIARIRGLVTEIAAWSEAEGWQVEQGQKTLREKFLGDYEVPTLLVRLPGGELSVNPIGLRVIGADGRIDLEAYPTLNRVKLAGAAQGWQIITDSNVPIRSPWNRDTFVQLAHDLIS